MKKKLDDAIMKQKHKIEELERENTKLANSLKEKDLETTSFIENIDKKILQTELEKNNEINVLENQLKIETEKKNMFSN